jgi:hypothetical protein
VPEPLEVGEEVELRLATGHDDPLGGLHLRGRVVRLEEIPPEGRARAGARADDRFEVGLAFEPDAGGDLDLLEVLERGLARAPGRPA